MSKPKFTPGPWRVGKHGSVVSDAPVPEVHGSDAIEYYGGHVICETITPSNARLVAASPELLEALSGLLKLAEQRIRGCGTLLIDEMAACDKAKDAIDKATKEPANAAQPNP